MANFYSLKIKERRNVQSFGRRRWWWGVFRHQTMTHTIQSHTRGGKLIFWRRRSKSHKRDSVFFFLISGCFLIIYSASAFDHWSMTTSRSSSRTDYLDRLTTWRSLQKLIANRKWETWASGSRRRRTRSRILCGIAARLRNRSRSLTLSWCKSGA